MRGKPMVDHLACRRIYSQPFTSPTHLAFFKQLFDTGRHF